MPDFYKPISKYYDRLSSIYSLGQIPRCRKAYLDEIKEAVRLAGTKEVRVCLVGVGHGEEAIAMAECGAHITVVDKSESMLDMFRVKLSCVSVETMNRVNIIHDDVRNIQHRYDWVVANFFLNVFSETEMEEMIIVLLESCSHGGRIMIGDFYYDSDGSWLARIMQKMNWCLAMFVFRAFVRNAMHDIYQYESCLMKRGWQVEDNKKFGLFGFCLYESTIYTRM